MKLKWLIVTMSLTFVLLFNQLTIASASSTFQDVSTEGTAAEIEYLVQQRIISGYTENNVKLFKPNNAVTRGQAIKMVVLAAGYTPIHVTQSSFKDINLEKSAELSSYVESAVANGLITVPADGLLKPMEPIKRDEMSKLLTLAFKFTVDTYAQLSLPFQDVTSEHPYYAYIAAIYYNGITKGNTTGDAYNAAEQVKRSQFASFVARAMSDKYRLPLPTQPKEEPLTVAKIVYVSSIGLNVRSTPSSANASNILGEAKLNEALPVYEDLGGWLKVAYNGQVGYVSAKYTKNEPAVSEATKPIAPQGEETNNDVTNNEQPIMPIPLTNVKGIATVNQLYVRELPNASSNALLQIDRGTEVAVHSIEGYWAKVTVNGVNGYIHKTYLRLVNRQGTAVAGRIIVLDAGHGGKDPGAVHKYADGTEVLEKTIVFEVVKRVQQKLEQDGAIVKLTRADDTFVELADRVKFTKNHFAELFVSVHVNAATNPAAQGTETFHSKSANENEKEDELLARAINNEIVANANMRNRDVKRENYQVISGVTMPAVLVELGFISNDADRSKLTDQAFIEIYAQSIYNGIVQYYQQ